MAMSNNSAVSEAALPAASADNKRLRLEFLDGMRGLAALYVVLFHVTQQFPEAIPHLPRLAQALMAPLQFGHFGVDVFIVLSGFCLMLPVARSHDGQLAGGTGAYLRRRARRILPPYYAALFLSIAVWGGPILVSAGMHGLRHQPVGPVLAQLGWDTTWRESLALHLVLLHNWFAFSNLSISAPLWSVAAEWQIYFLLPALLLPLWRRAGTAGMVLGAMAVGMIPHFALGASHNLDWTFPWYVELFAMGAAGAVIAQGRAGREASPGNERAWGPFCIGLLALLAVGVHVPALSRQAWLVDYLVGAATVAGILYAAQSTYRPRPPWLLRMLQARWVLLIGTFSYSLYLVHDIALHALSYVCRANLHIVGARGLAVSFVAGVPLSVLAAYGFYLVCERHFVSSAGRPRTERQAIAAAVREPAI